MGSVLGGRTPSAPSATPSPFLELAGGARGPGNRFAPAGFGFGFGFGSDRAVGRDQGLPG